MTNFLKQFSDELRWHQCFAEADLFEALVGKEQNGLFSRHQFMEALEQIASGTDSLVERLNQMTRLVQIEMLQADDNIQPPTLN